MDNLDPKFAYWASALLNMAVIVALMLSGVRMARRGDYARHRTRMFWAAALVGVFLVSYVFKVFGLGREDLDAWSRLDVWVLRFHELCVAAFVFGGAIALTIALRRGMPLARAERATVHARHRLAGWTAVAGVVLGVLSATWVLWGMYARLP